MAYPQPPSFYPVMSMPCGDSSTLLRNTCRPVMRHPPPPFPAQPFPPHDMPNPFSPPAPDGARFLPPPPPPSNMQQNFIAPIPIKPFSPQSMQDPFTPPSSAPQTPVPILELGQQNEILTQRWQWLPSMFCSIADDPTGDVYKIVTITWDGSCKDCYLKRVGEGGELEKKGKDVFEKDLIPAGRRGSMPPPLPRELTPPPSERGLTPPSSDSGSDQGVPVLELGHNGAGSGPAYGGGFQDSNSFPAGPRPADTEEYTSDDNNNDNEGKDAYEVKPSLSPAMAARGIFPADEEYYSNQSRSWGSSSDRSDDFYGGGGGNEQLGEDDQGFIAIRQPDRKPGESSGSLTKKSSSGKKHKRRQHHGDKERGSDKESPKKSSSKSRSRRGSASSKSDEEKKEKKSSNGHRVRREKHGSKPGLFW